MKGIYVKEKSALFGRSSTEETKKLMSLKKANTNNSMFGKTHSKDIINLLKQKALGRIQYEDTKLKMSAISGNPVNIYEKCSSEGFKLIGSFVSARRAAKFLDISGSTVIKYKNSGEIFKDRYKFSSK
jgi:group I intron endonuclease